MELSYLRFLKLWSRVHSPPICPRVYTAVTFPLPPNLALPERFFCSRFFRWWLFLSAQLSSHCGGTRFPPCCSLILLYSFLLHHPERFPALNVVSLGCKSSPALQCSIQPSGPPLLIPSFPSSWFTSQSTLLLLCTLVQLILIYAQTILPQTWSSHFLTLFSSLLSEPLPGSCLGLCITNTYKFSVISVSFITLPENHPVSPAHSQSILTKNPSTLRGPIIYSFY